MAPKKYLGVRLGTEGGEQTKRTLRDVGNAGQRSMNKITASARPASLELRAVNTAGALVNRMMKQAAGLAGAYLGLRGIQGFSRFLVEENRNFESYMANLETATGSIDKAKAAFARLDEFSEKTPFQLNEIVEAFIRLKNLGLEPSEAALISYGNTASSQSKTILQFVEAVADATTGEFERLKEFGIKAASEGEKVSFTFQGTTKTVRKNASDIEQALREIGDVNFAGAMEKQMDTLNGVFSNVSDNMSRFARNVGQAGFNEVLKDTAKNLTVVIDRSDDLAKSLGENLAVTLQATADAMGFLVENGSIIGTVLGGFLVARTGGVALSFLTKHIGLAIVSATAMTSTFGLTQVALTGLSVGARAAVGSLALLGGPAGIAALVGFGLYELATAETAAEKAARDHAEQLAVVRKEMGLFKDGITETTKETDALRESQLQLQKVVAQGNIKGVGKELFDGQGIGFVDSILGATRQDGVKFGQEIDDLAKKLKDGIFDVDEYATAIANLSKEYNDDGLLEVIQGELELVARYKASQKALEDVNKELAELNKNRAMSSFSIFGLGATIPVRDKPSRDSTNDNVRALNLDDFVGIQEIKPLTQTVEQYEKARDAISSTLAKMEIDALRATGNITEAIRREADAQIAIWREKGVAGAAAQEDMFRAITLINEQAARDIEKFQKEHDLGLQYGQSAAQTFTDSLIAAGATSSSVLEQLGRSFRTTMLKMVSDAFLLKPIQSIFGSIFSSLANFLPGAIGGSIGAPSPGLFSGGFGGFDHLGTVANANGNAFSNGNVIPFALGGIVDRPQYFPMSGGRRGLMGEAGEEAILPLTRGRNGKLGVQSSGGGTVVNLTIINAPEGTKTKQTPNANGGVDIDVIIPRAVAGDILGGGDVADALETRYGLAAGGV